MEPIRMIRGSFRVWRRAPLLASVVSLTLAAGIGVSVAVYSLVDTMLFRPVSAVSDPDRVVAVFTSENDSDPAVSSWVDFLDFREQNETFDSLTTYKPVSMDLLADERSDRIRGAMVTSDFLRVFGLNPQKGRFLSKSEDEIPLRDAVAVLSDASWRARFGADPGIIGRVLHLNGRAFRVIGVAPAGFRGANLLDAPEVYVSMMMQPHFMTSAGNLLDRRGWGGIFIIGRLESGVSLEQAEANLATIEAALIEAYPNTNQGRTITAVPFTKASLPPALRAQVARYSAMLLMTLGIVLVLVCANVAGLLQARTVSRRHELSIRRALGAGAWRVSGVVLGESMNLAAVGAGLGMFLAVWLAEVMTSVMPLPGPVEVALGVRTIFVTVGIALGCGLLCGIVPAFVVARKVAPHQLGGEKSQSVSGFSRPLAGLVSLQVALSVVLLVAAGLFLRTLVSLRGVALGFDARNVVVGMIDPGSRGLTPVEQGSILRDVSDRLGRNPAIENVAFSNILPLSGEGDSMGVWTERAADDEYKVVSIQLVNGSYFETLGLAIQKGRAFSDQGEVGMPLVVSSGLASYLWPGLDPIGQRLRFDPKGEQTATVVGVTGDAKSRALKGEPERTAYVSLFSAQAFGQTVSPIQVFVRSSAGPQMAISAMEDAVGSLAGGYPLNDVHTLDSQVEQAMAPERISAAAMFVAGLTGILLAAIGLYGLLSFFVSRATSEIGIRMAIGASSGDIGRLVLSRSIVPLGIGVVGGLGAAIAVMQFLQPFLYGVSAFDAVSFAGAVTLVVAVALVAASMPARRAVRISPIEALRVD